MITSALSNKARTKYKKEGEGLVVFPDPSGVVGRLNTQALSLIDTLTDEPGKSVREVTRLLIDLVMPRRHIGFWQAPAIWGIGRKLAGRRYKTLSSRGIRNVIFGEDLHCMSLLII